MCICAQAVKFDVIGKIVELRAIDRQLPAKRVSITVSGRRGEEQRKGRAAAAVKAAREEKHGDSSM